MFCVAMIPAAKPPVLLAWYDRHARALPWRTAPDDRAAGVVPDPYLVWLSEVMLQQTTVAAVKSYFEAFLARWPTVTALADAPEEEVMKAWAGLGYYSRARNLKKCADTIARDHGGRFPETEEKLLELPGIGAYTAAAIAAIAFDRPAAVVDGNIERVITRLAGLETPLPQAKPAIRDMVRSMMPKDRPGDFAQAMMDLGATICTPKRPACALCPWMADCEGRKAGIAETLPRKAKKIAKPTRRGMAFVIVREDGAVLLRRRPPRGLLGGMSEPPTTVWAEDAPTGDLALAPLALQWRRTPATVRHTFTHFHLEMAVWRADVPIQSAAPEGCWWSAPADLQDEALPTVMKKAVAEGIKHPAAKRMSRQA